jgi:hypothetical protein
MTPSLMIVQFEASFTFDRKRLQGRGQKAPRNAFVLCPGLLWSKMKYLNVCYKSLPQLRQLSQPSICSFP